jgi:hypothetical protein
VVAELGQLRTGVEKQCADLRSEADKYAEEVLRRSDEQATATRNKMAAQQEKITGAGRELDAAQAKVAEIEKSMADANERAQSAGREAERVQQRLTEVQQQLEVELKRVAEAKRAGEAAERHAADVRRQVQREAKRVAELASAAVLAAAASPGDEDDDPAYGEPAEAASAPQPSAPAVGQHAADKPASGQHAADKPAGGQHAAAEKPGKVTGSAKVTVPPSASRVGADAE